MTKKTETPPKKTPDADEEDRSDRFAWAGDDVLHIKITKAKTPPKE